MAGGFGVKRRHGHGGRDEHIKALHETTHVRAQGATALHELLYLQGA